MTREKIDWFESRAFDPQFEETYEQRLALVGSLGDSFVANGFQRPEERELRSIVVRARGHQSVLVQDTGGYGRENTRKPVEKFLVALIKALEAFEECLAVGELEPPPGHFNVARLLTEHADIYHLADLTYLAKGALYQGVTPKKREPFHAYDAFIARVWNACDPAPRDRASFVKLLLACEVTLPKSHRGLTKENVGDRFDAWVKRKPARRAAHERFMRELPQPMSLEEFIEASKPYFEPPPRPASSRRHGRHGPPSKANAKRA